MVNNLRKNEKELRCRKRLSIKSFRTVGFEINEARGMMNLKRVWLHSKLAINHVVRSKVTARVGTHTRTHRGGGAKAQ